MVIYAEYLFLENGLAGLVVLVLTKKLCGLETRRWKIAAGSILCGLYAFIIFWESLGFWAALLLKIGFSLGVVALVFPCTTLRRWCQGVLIFYMVSFAMGGIAIGTMYFMNIKGVTAGGAFYIGDITYPKVAVGIVLTWFLLSYLASFLKERLMKARTEVEVEISFGSETGIMKGMVDTGNFLTDPIYGKPVFLITKKAIQKLLPEYKDIGSRDFIESAESEVSRFHFIPYRSVGLKEGLLLGIRPDKVVLRDREKGAKCVDIILGIYQGTFPIGWDGKKYDLLLHPAVLEGGIAEGE